MAQDLAKGGNDIYGADDMLLASTDAPESPQGGALVPPPGIGAGVEDPATARSGVAVPSTPPHVPTLDARSRVDASHQTPKRQNDAGTQCFPGFSGPLSARKDGDSGFVYYGEPPKPVIVEKKVTNWKKTGLIAFAAAAAVALIVGLSVGLTVGKNNGGGAVSTTVTPYAVTLSGFPAGTSATSATSAVSAAGKQLRTDLATGAGLPAGANVYVTELRDASSGSVLSTFPRTHPANAAARRLSGLLAAEPVSRRALQQAPTSVIAVTLMFEIESTPANAAAITAALAAATAATNTGGSSVISAPSLKAITDALGLPANSIKVTGFVAVPSLVPIPTASALPTTTASASVSPSRSAAPTYTVSASATATIDYGILRTFAEHSIVTTRVDAAPANAGTFTRVIVDEYNINGYAIDPNLEKFPKPVAVKMQSFSLRNKECSTASSTNPAGGVCVTVPTGAEQDWKTGQITLSQDRCYLSVGGLDFPHGTQESYGTNSRLGFAVITNLPNDPTDANKPNLFTVQYQRNTATAPVSNMLATSKARVPRAVGYGRSRYETTDKADTGSLFWVDGTQSPAGSNSPDTYLKAVRYSPRDHYDAYMLDTGNGMDQPGSSLAFMTDQSNPPRFHQHLITTTEYTYGAVRVWPNQPAAGNTPCVGPRFQGSPTCQKSTTLYGPYGVSSGDVSKLGGVTGYFKVDMVESDLNVIFFSEKGAKAAVTRGLFANGQWLVQENIWPEEEPFQSDRNVHAITFSAEMYALFAVTPQNLYVGKNPLDFSFLVRWYQQKSASLVGTTYEYRGVATVPRSCLEPPAPSMTPSSSGTVSPSTVATKTVSATAVRTRSVTTSPSHSVSPTITTTPSPTASTVPIEFKFGNVVVSRVERFKTAPGASTYNTLARVHIEEHQWDVTDADRVNPAATKPAARMRQDWHFPHRERNSNGDATSEPYRLTLPFDDSLTWRQGQITLSQDRCSLGVAGLNVPASHVGAGALYDATTGAPASTADASYATLGYPVTVARVGGRGWRDYPATWYPNSYRHWLPDGRQLEGSVPAAAANVNVENLYAPRIEAIPKAAALTVVEAVNSQHAFQTFVVTNLKATTTSANDAGSMAGRCWFGLDSAGDLNGKQNDYCRGNIASILPPLYTPRSKTPNQWTPIDPGNTDGTTGICFVGPSTSFDQRLLQVRPRATGAIHQWPQSPGGGYDVSFTPTLDYAQYLRNPDPYTPVSVSRYAQQENIPEYAGWLDPTLTNLRPEKLGNCAGKTTGFTGVVFELDSYLFYSIRDGGAYAVSRTLWGESSQKNYWQKPEGIWSKAKNDPSTQALDDAVLGVAYFNEPSRGILYAVTRTGLFGSVNGDAAVAANVAWHRLSTVADPANNEYRGIAMAPRTCTYQNSMYRALGQDEEKVDPLVEAELRAMVEA